MALNDVMTLHVEARPAPDRPAATSATAADAAPLSLRLVDAGAVAIPADGEWGTSYSHGTLAFQQLLTDAPPFLDAGELSRVQRQWADYIDHVVGLGNNGVVLPLFLELIDFEAAGVYRGEPRWHQRHAALRQAVRGLTSYASEAGAAPYLATDMVALTPPLERHLRALPAGMDAARPEFWQVYAQGLAETFEHFPELAGVVIRIGEAGALYNIPGWDYRSELYVDRPAALRAMLQGLLPVFERHGRRLVLRTWSIGLGELGDLHHDPAEYEAVLGDIVSPALVLSTKFTAGDFFSYLELNPTLLQGRHPRLVELQARREFEGFLAFPNFVGPEHGEALRAITAANPAARGTYLWTQMGGPLRAGPRSLYRRVGFWTWSDVNVHVTSRLARNPDADARQLAEEWVRSELLDDAAFAAAVADVLEASRVAVEKGFYVAPFAERRVQIGSFELPPLMWVFEWDAVAGWSSILSVMHHAIGDDRERARQEGFDAVAVVDFMIERLEPFAVELEACGARCAGMTQSLRYERSLLQTLAWYRAAFLDYYEWVATGDVTARAGWRDAVQEYEVARDAHRARYAEDLDFPAFEFDSADTAMNIAALAPEAAWLARAMLVALGGVLLLVRSRPRLPAAAAGGTVVVVLFVTVVACSGFALVPARETLLAAAAFGLVGTAVGRRDGSGLERRLVHGLLWCLPLAGLLLAVTSVRGPHWFWYQFWTDAAFRPLFLAALSATIVWAVYGMTRSVCRGLHRDEVGGLLLVAGAGTALLAAVVLRAPDLLRVLDEPLGVLPMTEAVRSGILTYGVLPVRWLQTAQGGGVLAAVVGLFLVARRRRGARDRAASPA